MKKKAIKNKVRLMNKVNQMFIFECGVKYMYTTIEQVWMKRDGTTTGKLKSTGLPVVFDKDTQTWSELHEEVAT